MLVKTLSIRQPDAALVCAGVKAVENRTWKTDYRGRLLIHASGQEHRFYDLNSLPQKWCDMFVKYMDVADIFNAPENAPESIKKAFVLNRKMFKHYHLPIESPTTDKTLAAIPEAAKTYGFVFTAHTIIGEVTLVDIIRDSKDDFAEPNCYHWILDNAIYYDKPIVNVMGHLRLWDFDLTD